MYPAYQPLLLPLPAYRVPYLQFYLLSLDANHPGSKLNANREVVDWLEALVGELQKET